MKRSTIALFFVIAFTSLAGLSSALAATPACDSDNGGIQLPPGFCAIVVAEGLGIARHVVVAPNGDLYVALMGAGRKVAGGAIGLRDTDGDGRYETRVPITTGSSTGVALRNGYLYVAKTTSIERYKLTAGELKPASGPEMVVSQLPVQNEHEDKGIAFDGKGFFYINVGAPSNACQGRDRQKGSEGQDPCPLLEKHGGVWRFDENKLNQTLGDGVHYATGMRQMPAIAWQDDSLYVAVNGRDQLDTLWPEHFTADDNATLPAETLDKVAKNSDFGWPYCFFDYKQQKLLENPEYGGDGKTVGRCSQYALPIATYPAHWAPVDLMFYNGKAFPSHYQGGAFIAFHGSWNRSPLPQEGYNVTFQPFSHGRSSAKYEVFASGFPGKASIANPTDAVSRPDGVAEAPDGSLFVTDSEKGKIWHIVYRGGAKGKK
jgi:glucose/arabinose dehydrogenase